MRARRNASLSVGLLAALLSMLGCHEVTGVSPSPADRGQVVTISGSGFGATQGTGVVLEGGLEMEVLSWSDGAIEARVPAGLADGTHDVVVRKNADVSAPVPHQVSGPLAVLAPVFEASAANVLSGVLRFRTSRPAAVRVEVTGGGETLVVPPHVVESTGNQHAATIVGLEPQTAFTFHVHAAAGGEIVDDSSYVATTGALPAMLNLPTEVRAIDAAEMAPGFTLFGVTRTNAPIPTQTVGFPVAVDAEGDVRWYADPSANAITTVVPISAGTFLAIDERVGFEGVILEIDRLGNVLNQWTHPGLDTYHHAVAELPNGNFIALATEQRQIGGYPDGSGSTSWYIVGDKVVEFRRDGGIVSSLSTFDFLDPYRYYDSTEFHLPFWGQTYGVNNKDWTHANGLVYDPTDDSVILSLRHQSMIMKIRRDPAEFAWAIGEDWDSTSGDDDWPWLETDTPGLPPSFQHAPYLLANGNVMVYDNGNERPEGGSRPVEYDPDPVAGTAEQVWTWTDADYDPPLYSSFTGDADPLPGGTVLVADTGFASNPDAAFIGFRWMRLVEVRRADGLKVWELWIEDPAREWSWTGYDAERIASLFPPNPVLPD